MKKIVFSFWLVLSLCLALTGTALAAKTNTVRVTRTEIEPGYYMCAVWDGDTLLTLFDTVVGEDRVLDTTVDIGDTPLSGKTVQVGISNVNAEEPTVVAIPDVPVIPADDTPGKPDVPAKPVTPSGSGSSSSSSGTSYGVSLPTRVPGGKVSVSPRNAEKGATVTLIVTPNAGYRLEKLTVTDSKGKECGLTDKGNGKYTFTMPASKISVEVSFAKEGNASPAAPSASFPDVPSGHAFHSDISWVATQGYMGGYGDGSFRPGASTTRQALWMTLARMDGANPSAMADALTWAMESNISDGSNPGGAMSRQQMVTMLYRYAQKKGYNVTGGTSLDSFKDAASVADYARDAMSWAAGNGIVQGGANQTLNPAGIASRAHFAAFLHRFCMAVGLA